MKPEINKTSFGSVTIEGKSYEHDVIIRLDGSVEKRKKKLSKKLYGTSHVISLDEARYFYEKGTKWILIGTGQSGMVRLSDEAEQFFQKKGCRVTLMPTPKAIRCWNETKDAGVGLLHVTC